MTPQDRELVAGLCAARAGVRVDASKAYLLETRLAPVARREDYPSVEALIAALRETRDERLIWQVVEAMAAGESAFFRDSEPFLTFAEEVLPTLCEGGRESPVRIWSAACGTGQEVYSLAMLVEACEAAGSAGRVELFASDISERALEKAQSGLYTQFEVQRGLPIRMLVQHFEKEGEMWGVSPRLRQMVRWRRINLLADLSKVGGFEVIFCRYVLSCAVESVRARILENLAGALTPDGYLFLGSAEQADGITHALTPVPDHPGLYQRHPAFRVAA
ncbi:MAG TPA: protein-glutamate O-methyltransferase CheR [Phenylobacterium sp.]